MTLRPHDRNLQRLAAPVSPTGRYAWRIAPVALIAGLTACSSGFEAVSVYPRTHYEDAAADVLIYGHGFEPGSTASVKWYDAAGNPKSAAFVSVEVIDAYTMRGKLPDLTGQLPYGIYPYREFISNPYELHPGLYTCDADPQPVIWERGKTDGYCDKQGVPLAYAPAGQQIPLIPPGPVESVWNYYDWYESVITCAYGGAAGDITEEQLRLLIPDYGLGCFYPDNPNSDSDGAPEGVPLTYAYCPPEMPTVAVNVVVNLPDGRQSEIVEGITLLNYDNDYYYNEAFGYKVRGAFGAPVDFEIGPDAGAAIVVELGRQPGTVDDVDSPDIAVVSPVSNLVSIIWGPGFDPEGDVVTSFPTGARPVALAAGDINGDGQLDLVTANADSSSLSILYNLQGDFSSYREVSVTVVPSTVAAADLNGDGKADLVVGSEADAALQILLQGEGEDFSTATTVSDIGVLHLALGDLDGKQGLDIVASSAVNDPLYVLSNDGTGSFNRFEVSSPLPVEHIATALVEENGFQVQRIVDLNGDTFGDIAAIHDDPDPTRDSVLIFRGNLDSSSVYYADYSTRYELPAGPRAITVTDANGDAYDDVIGTFNLDLVTVNDDGTASVLVNAGNGAFQVDKTVAVGFAAVATGSLDLEGDGDYDLVVVNSSEADELGVVSILSNPSSIFEYLGSTLNYCE